MSYILEHRVRNITSASKCLLFRNCSRGWWWQPRGQWRKTGRCWQRDDRSNRWSYPRVTSACRLHRITSNEQTFYCFRTKATGCKPSQSAGSAVETDWTAWYWNWRGWFSNICHFSDRIKWTQRDILAGKTLSSKLKGVLDYIVSCFIPLSDFWHLTTV